MYQPLYLRIYIYCIFLCTAVYSMCKYHEHTLVNVSVCCWWKKDINQTLFKHCHFIIIFICLLCVTVSACQNLGLCRYLTLGLCICIRDCLTPSKKHCWLWMFVLQIYSTDLESTSDLDCSCKRETQNIFKQQLYVEDSDLFWCKMRTVYGLRKSLIMDCHLFKISDCLYDRTPKKIMTVESAAT